MELLFYNNLNYIYIKISDVFRFKERACDPYHETSHCSTGKNFNCEEFSPFSTNLFSTFFAFIVHIQLPLFPIFCTIPFLEFTFILSKFSPWECYFNMGFSSVAQLCPTLWQHGLQHTRPRPSPTPGIYSDSCPLGRRQWQPTPVLLPGKSHGRRSLVGCGPWGC